MSAPLNTPKKRFTVAEVAEDLGICTMTVYRAIRDGKLKTDRFGQQHRITQAQIDAWGSASA